MREQMVREVLAVALGLAGAVLAGWLLVTFVVAGEWLRLGLGLGMLVCAGAAVWAGRYDPAVPPRRRAGTEGVGQGGPAVNADRVRMPALPPRR